MPYHLDALGNTWQGLSPGAQVMTLNFMKSAAAGFVTCAIAIAFLLAFPFRKGENWSRWALLSISVSELSIIAYCTNQVKTLTPADPPLTAALVLIGISILGFLLSPKPASKEAG
jgi:peptidoglycan/LPS O-acetylase OafA/YrhL